MQQRSPREVVQELLEGYLVSSKRYPRTLPPELEAWYCYPVDDGHSIVCVLALDYREAEDMTDFLMAVPVKSVLRGYEIRSGYIVVDLPYDEVSGLRTPSSDDEY